MFYKLSEGHNLPHDPLKSLIAPRPIAWVGTRGDNGDNLAAYSFFAQLSMTQIGFSVTTDIRAEGVKDTLSNILTRSVFSLSLPSLQHAEAVANSGASLPSNIDEFEYFKIEKSECKLIDAPFVKGAGATLECQLEKEVDLGSSTFIVGKIIAVHIADNLLKDGLLDNTKMRNLARLGYFQYTSISDVFDQKTPRV